MKSVKVYPIKSPEKLKEFIKNAEAYDLLDVEVENRASVFDDMLKNKDERLKYALKKLEESRVDEGKIIVKDGKVIITLKIENVISIRLVFGDTTIINELGIAR